MRVILMLIVLAQCCVNVGKPVSRSFSYPPSPEIETVFPVTARCLSGKVVYTESEELKGALVEIVDRNGHRVSALLTDENGRFCFAHAEHGRYTLRISDPEFATILVPFTVSARAKSASAILQMRYAK